MRASVKPGAARGVGLASYPWGAFHCRLNIGKIDCQKYQHAATEMRLQHPIQIGKTSHLRNSPSIRTVGAINALDITARITHTLLCGRRFSD